jgi:hypothetical protein
MTEKSKPNPARRHHVIPQFYLAGFTDSGEKDGLLYAHDLRELKTWPAKPANVAFEKDFYRIEVPGIAPDEIEKVFWDVEGKAATVLKKIIESNNLPDTPEDYETLMRFMAQLEMRRPSVRQNLDHTHEKVLRIVTKMHATLPDDELRARFKYMREENPDVPELDLNAFRAFATSDNYTIEFSQNHYIKNLMTALLPVADDTLTPLLAMRNWMLMIADEGAGYFITTDRPVALSWTIEVPPLFENSPGFGLQNTVVFFPVSKRHLMYGTFDALKAPVAPADAETVALMNRIMCRSAVRFIYSTDENFVWKNHDDSIGDRRNLFDVIRDHQATKGDCNSPD